MSESNIETAMDITDQKPSTSIKQPASDSESSSEDFDDEDFTIDPRSSKKGEKQGKRTGIRKFTSKLDPTLKGLMGEANLRYARGDIEVAQKMCFEVMRQCPDAYEPYITLAQIFESNDITKYEGYLTIASCLYPYDSGIWCRLAEVNIQNDKAKEAISCYSRAIRACPKHIEFHIKRLELVEAIGDKRFALMCKRNMSNKLPKSQYQTIIELSKEVTKQYHEEKNYVKALEALQVPFKRVPKRVTQDLVNMMLELLLLTDRFAECLDVFIQHCNFTFEITVDTQSRIIVNSFVMPPNIQIDLKVKFIVCLIKMKCFDLLPPLIDSMIVQENVEEIGDLFLDVAEDLMTANLSQEALKLLVPLVKSSTYSLAAVWLKYAECLSNCNMLEQAVEAYFTVMTMAPEHIEVLYPLAMSLLKLDKKSEALEVLSQDLSSNKLDVAVLIERMKLLKQIDDLDEYWKCAEMLLSRHCVILKYPEELKLVITAQTVSEKVKKLRRMRNFRGDLKPIETSYESIREPSAEIEYKLFQEILAFAMEKKQYSQMQKFAFMGLISRKFTAQFKDIILAAFFACLYNRDTFHGYYIIRDLVFRSPHNSLGWNLFNMVLQNADDARHSRFIIRFQERCPNAECLQVIEANYELSSGNCNLALKFFMEKFRKNRSPHLSFLLGVILLQKYSKRKHNTDNRKLLSEMISYLFIYYAKNRCKNAKHECYYNLGRMYQQLGVMYLAEHYYTKVLEMEEVENPDILSLKHESAFNLHLIYKNSGNIVAARNILIKHITI